MHAFCQHPDAVFTAKQLFQVEIHLAAVLSQHGAGRNVHHAGEIRVRRERPLFFRTEIEHGTHAQRLETGAVRRSFNIGKRGAAVERAVFDMPSAAACISAQLPKIFARFKRAAARRVSLAAWGSASCVFMADACLASRLLFHGLPSAYAANSFLRSAIWSFSRAPSSVSST